MSPLPLLWNARGIIFSTCQSVCVCVRTCLGRGILLLACCWFRVCWWKDDRLYDGHQSLDIKPNLIFRSWLSYICKKSARFYCSLLSTWAFTICTYIFVRRIHEKVFIVNWKCYLWTVRSSCNCCSRSVQNFGRDWPSCINYYSQVTKWHILPHLQAQKCTMKKF